MLCSLVFQVEVVSMWTQTIWVPPWAASRKRRNSDRRTAMECRTVLSKWVTNNDELIILNSVTACDVNNAACPLASLSDFPGSAECRNGEHLVQFYIHVKVFFYFGILVFANRVYVNILHSLCFTVVDFSHKLTNILDRQTHVTV